MTQQLAITAATIHSDTSREDSNVRAYTQISSSQLSPRSKRPHDGGENEEDESKTFCVSPSLSSFFWNRTLRFPPAKPFLPSPSPPVLFLLFDMFSAALSSLLHKSMPLLEAQGRLSCSRIYPLVSGFIMPLKCYRNPQTFREELLQQRYYSTRSNAAGRLRLSFSSPKAPHLSQGAGFLASWLSCEENWQYHLERRTIQHTALLPLCCCTTGVPKAQGGRTYRV